FIARTNVRGLQRDLQGGRAAVDGQPVGGALVSRERGLKVTDDAAIHAAPPTPAHHVGDGVDIALIHDRPRRERSLPYGSTSGHCQLAHGFTSYLLDLTSPVLMLQSGSRNSLHEVALSHDIENDNWDQANDRPSHQQSPGVIVYGLEEGQA